MNGPQTVINNVTYEDFNKMRVCEIIGIDESGQGGIDYENRVIKAMQQAQVPELSIEGASAGFSSHGPGDIEAVFQNQDFIVEVKMSIKDQMGSGIVYYDRASGKFFPSEKMKNSSDLEDLDIIIAATESIKSDLDRYLDALGEIEPVELHQEQASRGASFIASKDALLQLKSQGLMRPINKYVDVPSSYIARKYNAKGTNYIQVGGKGLFYLGSNPLNLPVPEFTGDARVEIRLKQAGDSSGGTTRSFNKRLGNEAEPIQARRVDLMALGRFKGNLPNSPFTLDDPTSVRELFGYS